MIRFPAPARNSTCSFYRQRSNSCKRRLQSLFLGLVERAAHDCAAGAPHVAQPTPRAAPGAPRIVVRQPIISRPIHNPTATDVRFRVAPGATIKMSTFRAKYGWLGIDITARLLEHATETADSLSAKNVDLPSGDHSITVSISDSAGRTGSRVLRLSVVK
jgi:hypothetical protein